MKLPPFIVTLGTWNIVMATNFIYSANETIRDADIDAQAPLLHLFGTSFKLGGAVLRSASSPWCCSSLVLWYVLNHTAWGRHVYAVGDDPEAAKLSGIQTKKVLLAVYTLARRHLRLGRLGLDRPQRLDLAVLGRTDSTSRRSPRL